MRKSRTRRGRPHVEFPVCCDMRGMLSFQILWLLSKGPMHGQEIANEIARRRGSRPAPGTIYPALKDLREKKLIEGHRQGRRIVYNLMEGTKQEVEKACRYFCSAFGDIFQEYVARGTRSSTFDRPAP